MTTCLGLCPKKAVAVALVGGQPGGARIIAVDALKNLRHLLPLLAQPLAMTTCDAAATESAHSPQFPQPADSPPSASERTVTADAVAASAAPESKPAFG